VRRCAQEVFRAKCRTREHKESAEHKVTYCCPDSFEIRQGAEWSSRSSAVIKIAGIALGWPRSGIRRALATHLQSNGDTLNYRRVILRFEFNCA
jgi:hypothetical protein